MLGISRYYSAHCAHSLGIAHRFFLAPGTMPALGFSAQQNALDATRKAAPSPVAAPRRGIVRVAAGTRNRGLPTLPKMPNMTRLEDIKELKDLGINSSELSDLELRDVRVRGPLRVVAEGPGVAATPLSLLDPGTRRPRDKQTFDWLPKGFAWFPSSAQPVCNTRNGTPDAPCCCHAAREVGHLTERERRDALPPNPPGLLEMNHTVLVRSRLWFSWLRWPPTSRCPRLVRIPGPCG